MREYGKVGPKFWIGETGKAIKKGGSEAVIVALYLMTSPHANMLGLYYQPEMFIAHETGLGFEGAAKGLQRCIEAGFCRYDPDSEMVWVMEMAKYQIAESLSPNDNQCKGIQREYLALPENAHLAAFFEKYATSFNLTKRRDPRPKTVTPIEGASNPLRSQEQEQEQEQEKEQKQKALSASADATDDVTQIFAYWQKRMESPRSKLDKKRRKVIQAALDLAYTPAELCKAIRGCSLTPHNMGDNERNQKYNGVELIFRSADQIDRFISNDKVPPRAAASNQQTRIAEQSDANIAAWLAGATVDENTIEMEQ